MNEFVMTKRQPEVHRERKPACLLTLTKAAIISTGLGACGIVLDVRLALLAFGVGAVLTGTVLLSSRSLRVLIGGTALTLLGGTLGVWGIVEMIARQTAALPPDNTAVRFALQLIFLAAGMLCMFLPLMEMAKMRRFYTKRVAAECVRSQGYILWRYRFDGCMYDHAEQRCRSFFIPQTGQRCILQIDPLAPERACRHDRMMTAAQIIAGLMLMGEAVLSLWNMTGGMLV